MSSKFSLQLYLGFLFCWCVFGLHWLSQSRTGSLVLGEVNPAANMSANTVDQNVEPTTAAEVDQKKQAQLNLVQEKLQAFFQRHKDRFLNKVNGSIETKMTQDSIQIIIKGQGYFPDRVRADHGPVNQYYADVLDYLGALLTEYPELECMFLYQSQASEVYEPSLDAIYWSQKRSNDSVRWLVDRWPLVKKSQVKYTVESTTHVNPQIFIHLNVNYSAGQSL